MTRPFPLLPAILAMAAVVTASNILVQFRLGEALTWGALTYPFAFLVTDVTNRLAGAAAARRVVLAGFAAGVVWSLVAALMGATTFRIALASGTAFLAAQMLDVMVFDRLRNGSWWKAPLVSTLFGSTLDTTIFFSLAFAAGFTALGPAAEVAWANGLVPLLGAGPMVPLWISLGTADWMVKLALAAVALVPFRMIVVILMRPRAESR
ncbi:queuosine precursor transporter [Paracoccus sp. S-4012]|uniref:queuosine precursor transporter n=1 Tax=Paracoccus sp. S-4012 TaxID=2665648 RepID=UPI0012AF5B3F|nr:queuosine precursor transporter [Paracoccus sp. S-4012]MRX51503.1 queuosine precursor transporter [Paracoccus sp. S-4012]